MNRYIKYLQLLISVLAIVVFASCSDSKSDNEPKGPSGTARTLLVYMVAGNDLGASRLDDEDIREMTQAAKKGDFGNSRLLVYHAPYNGEVQLKEVKPDGSVSVLQSYGTATGESVTIARMRQVIADMKKYAPARDYGLVLWSHASGWLVDGVQESSARHRSYGQDRGRKMNISSLARALDGAGFSFIYFDCCFMGGVEVMYEMRNVAKTAVASAAEVALPGMPYHLSLKPLMSDEANPVEAARCTYEYYEGQPSQYDRSCTIAVVDLTAMADLASATRAVYASAPAPVPDNYVKKLFCNRAPYRDYYFDFADYVDALTADSPAARSAWHAAFAKAVIYKAQTAYFQSNVDLSVHCGLSTFIFDDADETTQSGYDSSSWYADVASALIH